MTKTMNLFAASLLSMTMASAFAAQKCGPAFDSVSFFADASGSMMQKAENGNVKAEVAKILVKKLAAATAADKPITAALYALAPYAELVPESSSENFAQSVNAAFNTRMEVFGRPSWMGERALKRLSTKVDGAGVAVLMTDGGFTGKINDPVKALEAFKAVNPNAPVFVLSLAQTEDEKSQVAELADIAGTPLINAYEMHEDEEAFKKFVDDYLLKDCEPVKSMELQGVTFAFDSAVVSSEGQSILEKGLAAVKKEANNQPFKIFGWTDAMGSVQYNQSLSQRRAESVKRWFVEAGIDESRMTTEGRSVSSKYPNDTREGRAKNRRVDLIFE